MLTHLEGAARAARGLAAHRHCSGRWQPLSTGQAWVWGHEGELWALRAVVQQDTSRGEGSSVGTTGVPHHMWVSHVTLSHWIYFMCTAASFIFTLQDKGDKGKADWMLLEVK